VSFRTALAVIAACALAGCGKPPGPPKHDEAPSADAAAFVVNGVSDADAPIQGCITMLGRAGKPDYVLIEDGVDTGAVGYIRIDGDLIKLALVASAASEGGGVRTFENVERGLKVVETYTIGDSHEESDSTDATGTVAVTYKGQTLLIPVEGGTAC
jgi:hypothetical protein